MTKEFRTWVNGIKDFVVRRIGKFATIELEEYDVEQYPLVICIIVNSNGLRLHMSFDQIEYDRNNEKQRQVLATTRCNDMAWSVGCEIDELIKIRDALKS